MIAATIATILQRKLTAKNKMKEQKNALPRSWKSLKKTDLGKSVYR
jgi:hypothetical protein